MARWRVATDSRSSRSSGVPYDALMPMQPRPISETSRPCRPSFRFPRLIPLLLLRRARESSRSSFAGIPASPAIRTMIFQLARLASASSRAIPQVPVRLTAGDYFAGRDPALDVVFRLIRESEAEPRQDLRCYDRLPCRLGWPSFDYG